MKNPFKTISHNVDFCVVGGGLAGMLAAISAARHGVKVALMHERPMLGGNASSEIRMWVGGAHGENNRETGILEEIALENLYRNPYKNYSIWDSILYEKVKFEPNITLLLNCSCNDAEMDGNKLKSVTGWQLTTQMWHTVYAKYFADCSGDSILAPLTGAEFRCGREAADDFNEDIAPCVADQKTMGLSCLIQAREYEEERTYIPPVWAEKISKKDLPFRMPDLNKSSENFWYLELGGTKDSIADTEEIRDELLELNFGVWDYIKNSGDIDAKNWDLDRMGFLPAKRESRRYVGDYIMTQNDVRAEGKFDDLVAYGGWSMDDHHPEGFRYEKEPTIYHPAPSPYGIAYRCLYSKNIENLWFAGRNISTTHTALSSTRVMGTCALLGQAVGTAAHIAAKYDETPRGVYKNHIEELKQSLMDDDCYLPFNKRELPKLTLNARLYAPHNAKIIQNGFERPLNGEGNMWVGKQGEKIEYHFEKKEEICEVRIVFDSDLNRVTVSGDKEIKNFSMGCNIKLNQVPSSVPKTLIKSFKLETMDDTGKIITIFEEGNNYQRLVKIPIFARAKMLRLTPLTTWGSEEFRIFAFDVK